MSEKVKSLPWVEKYRPKSIKEMALPTAKVSGNRVDLAEELTKFVKDFFKLSKEVNEQNKQIKIHNRNVPEKQQKEEIEIPPDKAAVLLEGQAGIGKTSIVYALANDLNMEVIETNASDTRTRDTLEKRLKETTKSRGIMDFVVQTREKLILIDEIDGLYGNKDRGAVPAIITLIQKTQFPIIMCSNEYKQNLSSLYNKIRRFEVHPLAKAEVIKIAKNILKKEGIKGLNESDLEVIAEKNGGDLRGVINDLQGICQGKEKSDLKLLVALKRDSNEEIFALIRDLFQKVSTLREARDLTDKSDVDYNFLYKWVSENLPTFIKQNENLANAYDNLSLADEIFGRIRKNMFWSLLPYFYDLFAGGVVISGNAPKTQGFRRVVFPRFSARGSSLSIAEKSLVEKVQEKYDISQTEVIQDFLPFLRVLSESSRRQLKLLSDWLALDAKEKKVLKKN